MPSETSHFTGVRMLKKFICHFKATSFLMQANEKKVFLGRCISPSLLSFHDLATMSNWLQRCSWHSHRSLDSTRKQQQGVMTEKKERSKVWLNFTNKVNNSKTIISSNESNVLKHLSTELGHWIHSCTYWYILMMSRCHKDCVYQSFIVDIYCFSLELLSSSVHRCSPSGGYESYL